MTIEKVIKQLLIEQPFYGLFLLGVNRYFSDDIKTAGVRKNGINVELCINKTFWDSLDPETAKSIIIHETNHILLKHLTTNWDEYEKENHILLNVAQDMECNSSIPKLQCDPWCYPQKINEPLFKGTKYYWEKLKQQNEFIPNPENNGFFQNGIAVPNHDWSDFQNVSEAEQELINKQIDFVAKNAAEQTLKSRGNLPGHLTEYLNGLFKEREAVFNWKAYFRRLVGFSINTYLKSTRYKPSKRFPDANGNILKTKPSVLVAVDTSGSVSNSELSDFFTEINHLYKSGVSVDIVEFDTQIHTKFPYKGLSTDIQIGGRGGTDCTQVINYYKSNRNYSTLVIFTDGYLNTNFGKLLNTIWVISSNGNHENTYPGKVVFIPKENN